MTLSVIIITKNEEKMVEDCLGSVSFADEIIIVDDNSTDKTREIAKKYTDKIYIHLQKNFAGQRNYGLEKSSGDWILYLDADERITPQLKSEIIDIARNPPAPSEHEGQPVTPKQFNGYYIYRQNYYLGKKWPQTEIIPRLFKRSALKSWQGEVHESPVIEGEYGRLQYPILHFTHRDIGSMLEKTLEWSKIEAELRFNAGHPMVVPWRFARVMLGEFLYYYIKQGGWKAGTVGVIESIYQAFSIFITYARLYEMQKRKFEI